MQNNRDRLQAHLFVVGRLVNAIIQAEPDQAIRPMRRSIRGWFYGLMVGVLVIAGCAIYGLIFPGGETGWRDGNGVIVDKQTGTRYLLLPDGRLHPVLNLASAMLAVGGARPPELLLVSGKALAEVPRGDTIGIPGAPDALPEAGRLASGPWAGCSMSWSAAGAKRVNLSLTLGEVSGFQELDAAEGLVVQAPDNTRYLIWHGRRFKISSPAIALALGIGNVQPLLVDQRWVNLFEPGNELRSPGIPGMGQAGPVVAGQPAVVGQVFQVRSLGGGVSYYVLMGGGMQPITVTVAAILTGDPDNAALYGSAAPRPIDVSTAAIAAVPAVGSTPADGGWPSAPPLTKLSANDNVAPCVRIVPQRDAAPTLKIGVVRTEGSRPNDSATTLPSGISLDIHPRGGALVNLVANGSTTLYLITDQGRKYAIGGPESDERDVAQTAATLGYDAAAAIRMPSAVVDLISTGPALDPSRALDVQTGLVGG